MLPADEGEIGTVFVFAALVAVSGVAPTVLVNVGGEGAGSGDPDPVA